MKVVCTYGCGLTFDDAIRDTICPHRELIGPYATPETEEGIASQKALAGFMDDCMRGIEMMKANSTESAAAADTAQGAPTIEGPKLETFVNPESVKCGQCGATNGRMRRFLLWITGRWVTSPFTIRFCPGGKMPTERADGPAGALFGIENAHKCAGIYEPHLHFNCGRCGCETLHELRPGK